jgi:glycosyltransferase involved in cell wall biosynthesis
MEQGGLRIKRKIERGSREGEPLISIITVVFNGDKHLERTIKSVAGQSYGNIEYIIIDGNSTDRSVEIIKKYDENIDFWISEPDDGISDAFNKGLSYSNGDYIGFINSDDWYEKDGVLSIVKEINPEESIYCGHLNLYSSDSHEFIKLHKSNPERIFQTMRMAHPSTFVSRCVFDQIGGFSTDYRYAMDYDFILRAKLNGNRIKLVDRVIANQMMGGNSSDLLKVYKDELVIKNNLLGCKIDHWVWYLGNVFLYFPLTLIKKIRKK